MSPRHTDRAQLENLQRTMEQDRDGRTGGTKEKVQSITRTQTHTHTVEGSLEVKLPTIWTDGKAEVVRVKEEKRRRKKIKKRKSHKKEDPGARKGRKAAKHYVFPMMCGSGGSKSRLAKAAGAEPAGQMRDEKLRAVVARSTFPSQKCKKLTGSDHFWKLRCRKSAGRCGAKYICK